MIFGSRFPQVLAFFAAFFCCVTAQADTPSIAALLQQVEDYPYTTQVSSSQQQVIEHEVGLGAIQKVRGEWHFKKSERLTGTLHSYTWQIGNGFSSSEVMAQLLKSIEQIDGAKELYSCVGRACGRSVQWANRVFKERVLYGREDAQRYSVFAQEGTSPARVLVYSAERTADRQYLHVEWLQILP